MKNFIIIFFLIIASFNLHAINKEKMIRDLDIIKSTFEAKYAPFEWKKTYAGWSLDAEIDLAKAKIESSSNLSIHDYQRILHAFFISTCDYHVGNEYFSTEMALLPFSVTGANGHYYVTKIEESYLQQLVELGVYRGQIIPSLGDELVFFDGKPTDDVIQQLKVEELGNVASRTSQVLAESILTQRLRSLGHQVPQGTLQLQFKKIAGGIFNAEIDWVYQPELIVNRHAAMFPSSDLQKLDTNEETPERYKTMVINPVAETLKADRSKIYQKFISQAKKNASNPSQDLAKEEEAHNPKSLERSLLTLGPKVWQEGAITPFKAYIYRSPTKQKRIGYIRISTYAPNSNMNIVSNTALQLANILRYFEKNTDALVIDQVDNPGGYLLYAYAVLAMLTDQPLTGMQHQVTITQEDVAQAFNDIEQIASEIEGGPAASYVAGYPKTIEFLQAYIGYSEFIIEEWKAGRTLTGHINVQGLPTIAPHSQAHYNKPILMLVDSRDFSCADVVPAVLQDNHRAVIFGEQTAGAGGIVKNHSYPNLFGLAKFSYTASIFERQNGLRLENLGVTPDVPYELTPNDLLYGYKDYIEAVNIAVESLLK